MILIVGSIASGKTTYAKSLGYTDGDIEDMAAPVGAATSTVLDGEVLDGAAAAALADSTSLPVADNAHVAVRHALRKDESLDALCEFLAAREVVIFAEVGSGVISIDPADVAYREQVGRLCTVLAKRATRVVRTVCGIPVVLKGDEANPR